MFSSPACVSFIYGLLYYVDYGESVYYVFVCRSRLLSSVELCDAIDCKWSYWLREEKVSSLEGQEPMGWGGGGAE